MLDDPPFIIIHVSFSAQAGDSVYSTKIVLLTFLPVTSLFNNRFMYFYSSKYYINCRKLIRDGWLVLGLVL